jgi:hypothetical protein
MGDMLKDIAHLSDADRISINVGWLRSLLKTEQHCEEVRAELTDAYDKIKRLRERQP